jgi:hypothetical protein
MQPRLPIFAALLTLGAAPLFVPAHPAHAATITVEYAAGHRAVVINDYGTPALGTFTLDDAGHDLLALCVEAGDSHSTAIDAYAPVANRIDSAELDTLLWLLSDGATLDADTATAAAALAWYYAGATRTIGAPVWSDGARGFSPITPDAPEAWDALSPYGVAHPVGLRAAGVELDASERRVAELHRTVMAMSGLWTLAPDPTARAVRLTAAAGPIAGRSVSFTVTPTGASPLSLTAVTDADGWARPQLPALLDGGHITATVDAPDEHREWDGPGVIQRMVTGGGRIVSTGFEVQPAPRYMQVLKRSTDPTIAVGAATFELVDANGTTFASATTGADGVARFDAVDTALHPLPFALRETVAPPGLLPIAGELAIPAASHDPAEPTVIEVSDQPRTTSIRVRKQLSAPAGTGDLSGFGFSVHRAEGGFDDELITAGDGLTEAVAVPLGTFTICEIRVPDWAVAQVDGGCLELVVDLARLDASQPVTLDYLNIVPTAPPTTTTVPGQPATTSTLPWAPVVTHPGSPSPSGRGPVSGTLPKTGNAAGARLLHIGDAMYVAGVALIALTMLGSRRKRPGRLSRAG